MDSLTLTNWLFMLIGFLVSGSIAFIFLGQKIAVLEAIVTRIEKKVNDLERKS